jgi:hypothetical protein
MEGMQMNNETVPTKFCADASFNHLIEVRNSSDALLTIHNDGTITAAEHLKPTETAAEVLRIMRETWMDDIQSKKIRYQQDHIKRLEDIISRAAYAFFRDGSDGKAANGMLTILEEARKP